MVIAAAAVVDLALQAVMESRVLVVAAVVLVHLIHILDQQ
jgi:hypothetical protein